ncbi:MAG: di-trans,poly-cis-decaprenylcistransferase [Hydrogenophaga sp.]|uniref:polyprenyl diphosphate synthase n=1 Tax=Hydrogenophaga sp. TaxID=1904254 RepID=UPI0025B7E54B|nr:polyprenyl diphosphate synthase [Hydrogenophaga sp.]MBT9553953.1 di-trans,poly-cis-decaprenylcistransferase [Hydrogenophaga sp.]
MAHTLPPASCVPRHVAIVMDGNGRWAQKRHLPRVAGHKQGVDALRRTVRACLERNVQVLTVFAFSSENWSRPEDEVSGLMSLLLMALSREVPKLSKNGVQLHFPGDAGGLSSRVLQGLQKAEQTTAHNQKMVLNVCFNYGGRWDIAQAARRLVEQGKEITEAGLCESTALAHVGDPDLLIRTGGEMRVSNFLLWQCAYTELFFTPCLWPDFDAAELDRAFADFAGRERRFGLTSEQLVTPSGAPSHA